jgi:hypothetical protein
MNINDRKRISALIESEFRARREAISQEPTAEEIAKEMDAILQKNKLRDKANKLAEARALVESLDKQMSVAVGVLRKQAKTKKRGRYDGCECHDDYAEVLQEIAKSNILESKKVDRTKDWLLSEERKLLTKVEIAKSVDDLEKIAKEAGLI